jgi:hypothetical protein
MPSKAGIFNRALYEIGAGRVPDPDSSTDERAIVLNDLYPQVKDEVLQAHDWACATFRKRLAQVSGNLTPFDYAYALPTDPLFLRLQALLEAERETYEELTTAKWRIEGNTLYCDYSELAIRYTGRITQEGNLHPHVAEVIAYALAAQAAMPLQESPQMQTSLVQYYQSTALPIAMARDGELYENGLENDDVRNPFAGYEPWTDYH